MKCYNITITGSGSVGEITKALNELLKTLEHLPEDTHRKITYEDQTLITEISKVYD